MSGASGGILLPNVVKELNKFADLKLAESWDNVGLLIEPTTSIIVNSVLLTNDLTESVLEEAVNLRINLIISYHPPIFSALKRITTATWKERIVATCLENKIAVYSPHTAWDATFGGVADWLTDAFRGNFDEAKRHTIVPSNALLENAYSADIIGPSRKIDPFINDLLLRNITCIPIHEMSNGKKMYKISGCTRKDIDLFLEVEDTNITVTKTETRINKNIGMGRIIHTSDLTIFDCITLLKRYTGLTHIRLALGVKKTEDSLVSKIALVPGSGGSLLRGVSADLYVTGEMFHHDILEANHNGTSVILLNHSDSERGFLKTMRMKLETIFPNISFFVSTYDRDPIKTV